MKIASRQIERYRLRKELSTEDKQKAGRQTFLAKDAESGESVVIKIIRLEQAIHTADQWVEIKLFERESEILQTLNHSSLPKYKEAFETEIEGVRSFVLVQSYIEANSLETLLQAGKRFSEGDVIDIAEQLLDTLMYLHAQTPLVIHRDIKPSNILIDQNTQNENDSIGNIYLIDFGSIHTDLTKESGTITIVGSYGYIPLEQFSGQAVPASDLYSLGMALIYLITGTHPADMAHVNGRIQLAAYSLEPGFARWLQRMTHLDLSQRFDSAEQASEMLHAKEQDQSSYQSLKPEGSKVVLRRENGRIEIWTDKPGDSSIELGKASTFLICLAVGFYFPSLFIISIILMSAFNLVIGSFLTHLLDGLLAIRWQSVVEIDREKGIRTGARIKGRTAVKWRNQTSRFKDIDLLAYSPGYKFDSYTQGNNTIRQSSGISPELSIHASDISYPVGHAQLSAAECWWLGQELSDFLDLELQTIYPMPIVTVADNSCGGCGC
ncbi:MAG: serine/threonine-protein kinase [Cyanobacteria bacterium P01_D01_bin.1]